MNAAFKGFFMFSEIYWDFPGSLVMKTMLPLQGAIPGQGTKISHTMWHSQKLEKKSKNNNNNNSNKTQLDKKNEVKTTTNP